jgi:acetyltransferase-like isoleucine patch superfamily enzyme
MLNLIKNSLLRRLAVRKNVTIGERFHVGIGSTVWAPRSLTIGNDVYVGKNVTIQVDGVIGDGVLFANLSGIVGKTDHRSDQVGTLIRRSEWVGDNPDSLSHTTTIGTDVWVGYGAVVLSGITVGDSSIVGAGAVVTRDVPPNSIVVGNPARVVGQRFSDEQLDAHWASLRSAGHRLQPFATSIRS